MLIRSHPRSIRSNILRLIRLAKNHDHFQLERLELSRRMPFPGRARALFSSTSDFLKDSQWWSKKQHRVYQEERFQHLVEYARSKALYYRDALPPTPVSLETIADIPFLTREIIEEHFEHLIVDGVSPDRLEYFTTGGSTGIPMRFYLDAEYTDTVREAFFGRMWGWIGYRPYERGVILRGIPIDSTNPDAYYDYDVLENKLLLSTYHMKEEWFERIYKAIMQFDPISIQAYPSAATMLAQYMLNESLSPPSSLRRVLCGSENIYGWQRELIHKAFSCRVFSWYGHSENVLLGGECEHSTDLHMFSEHGYLELIRPDGTLIVDAGEVGEIVGTGFINDVMPFIRYRTGDLGQYARGACKCGREYPRLQHIEGRLQELVVTKDGRWISMTAINMHSDLFDNVRQFQFEQFQAGELLMRIVRKPGYSERDEKKIHRELITKMGDDMRIEYHFVDTIPLTSRGKHRFLIQHISDPFGDKP